MTSFKERLANVPKKLGLTTGLVALALLASQASAQTNLDISPTRLDPAHQENNQTFDEVPTYNHKRDLQTFKQKQFETLAQKYLSEHTHLTLIIGYEVDKTQDSSQKPNNFPQKLASDLRTQELTKNLQDRGVEVIYQAQNVPSIIIRLRSENLKNNSKLLHYISGLDAHFIQHADTPTITQGINPIAESAVGLERAREIGASGANWPTIVIDSGVDPNHPSLRGRIINQGCAISDPGTSCPSGKNFEISPQAASNCALSRDNCDHGSATASVVTNFSDGPIFPFMVGNTNADVFIAIDQVMASQAKFASVSLSLGWGEGFVGNCASSEVAFRELLWVLTHRYGAALSVASGNNGFANGTLSPACIVLGESAYRDGLIAVGASHLDQKGLSSVASYSNRSEGIVNILAPANLLGAVAHTNSNERMAGTSMAAPVVAAMLARLREVHPRQWPASQEQLLNQTGNQVSETYAYANVPPRTYTVPQVNIGTAAHHGALMADPAFLKDKVFLPHINR